MSFNYGREKRKFDEEWETLHREYVEAGMSEQAIEQLRAFDWSWFCSRRIYENHMMQSLDEANSEERDGKALLRRFSTLATPFEADRGVAGRYAWLHDIEDEALSQKLKKLKEKDIELLTLLYEENYKESEVAKLWKCSRSNVTQRLKKIMKIILK